MATRLKRSLGLFEATAYGVGIIVGAGIYALIGPAAGLAGNMLWLAFVVGAAVSVFTGLSYAELSSMFPKEAAEYVYIKRAYGSEYMAFLLGWLIIFTGIVSITAVSLGFAGYFSSLFHIGNSYLIILVAAALIVLLSFVNFSGIKQSSKINIILTALSILGLVLVIVLGAGKIGSVDYLQNAGSFSGVFSAAALIFFAYIGFEEIVNVSEETKKARTIVPKAIILAVIITTILYALTSISAVSLVDWKELSKTDAPLALAASKSFLGQNSQLVISVIATFATAGTVLGISIVVSRMIYGMSNERVLPKILSRVHKKTKTPHVAAAIVALLSIIFLFYGGIKQVAEVTSLGALMTFTAINVALIWLRYTKPNMQRRFKVPLNIGRYPIIAFLGVFASLFMIFQFNISLIGMSLVILSIGTFVYVLYKKGYIGEVVKDTTGIDIEKR